jgi:dihydrofolate reductase
MRGKAILKTVSQSYGVMTKRRRVRVEEPATPVVTEEMQPVKIPACYYVATSADGLIADQLGNVDWLTPYLEKDYTFHRFLDSIDTVVMGRRTYERILKSTRTNPYEGKHFVVLSHSRSIGPYATLFWQGLPEDLIPCLDEMGSKSLWIVGGGCVAGAFLEAGLLGEVQQFVVPVVLGSGTPLFGALRQQASLRLKDSHPFENGVVRLRYIL